MALPNPWYINANARHQAATQRLLAYAAVEGQEGVLGATHLEVRAAQTPNGTIQAYPGAYSVLAKHLGGSFEAYLGKIDVAETVAVNPTNSSGPRTDLVILRVENPYVTGSGAWAAPADTVEGPYVHVRVIEGVDPNLVHVLGHNNTWSAITLARITRPANTGFVNQGHITDLRSLATLREQRLIVINNQSPTIPPIAQDYWTESTPVGNNAQLLGSETGWKDFPSGLSWNVPVPIWALGVDIDVLTQPALTLGSLSGQFRVVFGTDTPDAVPTDFAEDLDGTTRRRPIFMIGGTESLSSGIRGTVVSVKIQARSTNGALPGRLRFEPGSRINLRFNFKRYPVFSDVA